MKHSIKEKAAWAVETALRKGANAVRVHAREEISDTMAVRDNELEKIYQAGESSLFFHLFVDGRYGTCSCNATEPKEVESLLENALAATKLLDKDECRALPPADRCFHGTPMDLQQTDPIIETITARQKKEYAFACAAETCDTNAPVISVTSEYTDSKETAYLLDSNGLDCSSSQTFFSLSTECTVKGEKDARPSDWSCRGGLYAANLKPGCGKEALERALEKIGPRKIRSGAYATVVENRTAATLLSPIIQAISGAALQQNNSFLLHRMGERIASPLFTLKDDPLRVGTTGARAFDDEGIATQPRTILAEGVLQTHYLSSYYARKMHTEPTADAPSVLWMPNGKGNVQTLIQSLDKGIFITGFNGGNCNGATGDFSYGVEGFYIEKGHKAYPISEMVLTGNMLDLWQQLQAFGSDTLSYTAWQIPSLLFDNLVFTGI